MAVIGRASPFLVGSALTLLATFALRAAPPRTGAPAQPAPAQAPAAVDFARDVQPLLERHCYECHGAKKARGRLRLHGPDQIAKGGQTGPAVVAGDVEHSLLMRRVLGLDDEDRMPLDADPLSDGELATLRGWIASGAAMPAAAQTTAATDVVEHWAYVKPVRPPLPAVARAAWVRTPIDRFVLARLDKEQLTPAPEAERHTLLRRVTLDLTGLAPTLAEIDAFLADTAPGAYERAVDRLLASPRYGERWARPWLDLARYADTNGYEKDKRRDMWKYRDWVIDALNADMPFDRFTVEQIAGDMLPDATEAQRIASGFHRNAMSNEEGGVDPDESMYEVLVDRVNTTATVWLGSTVGCAQCHNHKYDPFSQKDYFRLLAFFANPAYETQVSGDGTRYYEARLDLATAEQAAKRTAAQAEVKRLEVALTEATPALAEGQRAWEEAIRAGDRAWTVLAPREATATNGVRLATKPDGSILASGPNAELTTYIATFETKAEGLTGLRLEALPDASLPRGGPGRDAYGHFRVTGLALSIAPLAGGPGGGAAMPLAIETIRVDDSAAAFEPADLLSGGATGGGRGKRRSWGINALRETTRLPRHAVLQAAAPFGFPGGTRVTLQIAQEDGSIGQGIGSFRVAVTAAADPLDRGDAAAAAAAGRVARGECARRRRGRGRRHALPPDHAVVEADPRGAQGGAQGARRPAAAEHARHAGSARLRATVLRAARARRLHVARRADVRADAAGAAADEGVAAGQPPRPGALAGRSRQPARRAGPGEPVVGAALRPRPGGNQRGLRHAGSAAVAPGAARLAGGRVDGSRLEPENAAADHRRVGHLSPGVGGAGGARRARSLQPAVRARAALPPRSRDDPRRRAGRERAAERQDARAERVPSPARGHLEHALQRGSLGRKRWRGSLPPQPLHLPAADVPLPDAHDVRRHQPRVPARPGASAPTRRCRR